MQSRGHFRDGDVASKLGDLLQGAAAEGGQGLAPRAQKLLLTTLGKSQLWLLLLKLLLMLLLV